MAGSSLKDSSPLWLGIHIFAWIFMIVKISHIYLSEITDVR